LSSTNPIVGGVVQLAPGDSNVSITFHIVPDTGVLSFDSFYNVTSADITVDSCSAVGTPNIAALCPGPTSDLAIASFGADYDPAVTAPFEIGTVVISVSATALLDEALETAVGFIQDVDGVTPLLGGQVFAIVVAP
jgi:hypothetical protein